MVHVFFKNWNSQLSNIFNIVFGVLQNAILNEKEADDYMRNPCERAEHKWLVIELCETIQV